MSSTSATCLAIRSLTRMQDIPTKVAPPTASSAFQADIAAGDDVKAARAAVQRLDDAGFEIVEAAR